MQPLRTALINRNYARLWYGQAISTVGDYMFDTTVVLWVAIVLAKGKTWAPAAFCSRSVRRYWLSVPSPAYSSTGGTGAPPCCAPNDRARAAGLGQATTATAMIIGPPLAAPLLFTVGLRWALLLNAASYAVSFVAIRSVRLNPSADGDGRAEARGQASSLGREFAAGLRFFAGNRFLVALLTIAVICQCGTGAIGALDVFFVTWNLHASAHLYGFMSMAFGIGAVAGSLWASRGLAG